LARSPIVSPGAKLLYGSLREFAGAGGRCFPCIGALAASIARSRRQTARYLAELSRTGLIRRVRHGLNQSNSYLFLWHPLFEPSKSLIPQDVPSMTLLDAPSEALLDVPSVAHKEDQLRGSGEEEFDRSTEPPPAVEIPAPVPPAAWKPTEFETIGKAIGIFRYTNGEAARAETAMLRRLERIGRIYAVTPFYIAALLYRKYQLVASKPSLAPDGPAWFAAVVESHLLERFAPAPPPPPRPAPAKPPRRDPQGRGFANSLVAALAATKGFK
jgi:hypothetical protein